MFFPTSSRAIICAIINTTTVILAILLLVVVGMDADVISRFMQRVVQCVEYGLSVRRGISKLFEDRRGMLAYNVCMYVCMYKLYMYELCMYVCMYVCK